MSVDWHHLIVPTRLAFRHAGKDGFRPLSCFWSVAVGKGVKKIEQRKALLLHTAGLTVQDSFFTLDEDEARIITKKQRMRLINISNLKQISVLNERVCFRDVTAN